MENIKIKKDQINYIVDYNFKKIKIYNKIFFIIKYFIKNKKIRIKKNQQLQGIISFKKL